MKKLTLIFTLSLLSLFAMAQLENKGNIYIQVGMPVFEDAGQNPAESIFAGYNTVPYFGGYAFYSFNSRMHAGGSLKVLVANKTNFSLSNTSFGAVFRYNILPIDRTISPFVMVEGNINYTYISQKESNITITDLEVSGDEDVVLTRIEYQQPEINVGVFPVFGAYASIGTDITPGSSNKNFGMFLSVDYYLNNVSSQDIIMEKFPNNTSEFKYWSVSLGVRISFIRKKDIF